MSLSLGTPAFGRSVLGVLSVATAACLALTWLVPDGWLAAALGPLIGD